MRTESTVESAGDAGAFPGRKVILGGLIVVFIIWLLPSVINANNYHGDERFYTDAALRMTVTGDYITPYFGDGSLRFTKPALVYWFISASYHLFGVSLFTSRLPFLLAGAVTLALTYKIGSLLFNDRSIGLAAAAILASNITFIKVSSRTTPDIILALFFTLSVYGFISLALSGKLKSRNFLMAYAGAGAAVAAKGLLGIFPVIYAWLYSLIRRRGTTGIRNIIRLKYLVLFALIGGFWFVLVFILHGREVFSVFFSDQVGDKVVESRWQILTNLSAFILAPARHFFPWSLIVLAAALIRRDVVAGIFHEHRESVYYIAGVFFLMVIAFSGSDDLRTRYLLPSYPLLSCLFAAVIVRTAGSGDSARVVMRKFAMSFMAFVFALSAALALFGSRIHPLMLAGGAISCLLIVALFLRVRRNKKSYGLVATAIVLLTANILVTVSIRGAFTHSPSRAMAARIAYEAGDEPRVAVVNINNHYPAQMRIYFKGRAEMREFSRLPSLDQLFEFDAVLTSERYVKRLEDAKYIVEKCGFEYDRWTTEEIFALFREKDIDARFAEKRIDYYFAVKRTE